MKIFTAIMITVIENLTHLGVMLYLTNVSITKLSNSIRCFLLITLSTIIMHFVQIYDNSCIELGMAISLTQYTIVTKLISHETLKNTITAVFFTYIFQFAIQSPIVLIALLNIDFNIVTSLNINLVIMLLTLLITVLIINFSPIRKLYEKILKIPFFIIFTITFICAFYGIISSFFNEIHMSESILIIGIFSFLILAFFFIIFFIIFFALRAQNKEQAVHYYETYMPILDDIILNIRMAQHNYNNTILSIANLPDIVSDYDSLTTQLKKYSSQMIKNTIPTRFLHFENKLLTALLYNKYCLAKDKKINIEISIHNYYYKSKANEFQIVDLTGILLDNAIDASNPNDTIYVEIGLCDYNNNYHNSYSKEGTTSPFLIIVKNPGPEATQDFIKDIFTIDYTSKKSNKEKHGLGLPYVKMLTNQYNGNIEVGNEMIKCDDSETSKRYFIIHIKI